MNRRGWVKAGVFGVVASSILAFAGTAFARKGGGWGCHGGGGRGDFMKSMATAHINEALDAAKVTGAARETVNAARDRVFAAFEEAHKDRDRGAEIERALKLFEADTLDVKEVEAIRQEKVASMQKVGDEITQALIDVHDALTPEQRKALTQYVRENGPGRWKK